MPHPNYWYQILDTLVACALFGVFMWALIRILRKRHPGH